MSDLINIARHASSESFHEVLKRVVAAQPEIYMSGHEGYYRHDDIARLIIELSDRASDDARLLMEARDKADRYRKAGFSAVSELITALADRLADAGKAITPATSGPA